MTPFYQRDGITIFCGDCLDILPGLAGIDSLVTDPPYGININKSNRLSISRGFGNENWDSQPLPQKDIDSLLIKANNLIIWGGNYYILPPSRGFLIWDKNNDNRDFADIEMAWTNLDMVARIFRYRPMNMDGGKVHPTQKPIALMRWCIQQIKAPGLICDPYMGSGSTLVAAQDLGYSAIGIEISEAYCQIAVDRLRQPSLFYSLPAQPQPKPQQAAMEL